MQPTHHPNQQGPLTGLRIIEFAGLGPGPFACMLLSDMGAQVIRIDRPGAPPSSPLDIVARGRSTVYLDLKSESDKVQVMELLGHADALVEGFRPGVMERLGLGPAEVARHNPRLVYGRMTGWGQTGPLAHAAGHDINYISLTGALAAIGEKDGAPVPPLNLLGDYGGGSLYLVMGLLAALLEAQRSGQGQVVDAAICDGALSLMSNNLSHTQRGLYQPQRGSNMLDGGAPYYAVYATADAKYVSLGSIEPKFFSMLCEQLHIDPVLRDAQHDPSRWPALKQAIAQAIATRTQDEWRLLLEGSDVCFAPVLTLQEATQHPHIQSRHSLPTIGGVLHTAPAPRFSRTPSAIQTTTNAAAVSVAQLLANWQTVPTD